jgi:hypothetical protein
MQVRTCSRAKESDHLCLLIRLLGYLGKSICMHVGGALLFHVATETSPHAPFRQSFPRKGNAKYGTKSAASVRIYAWLVSVSRWTVTGRWHGHTAPWHACLLLPPDEVCSYSVFFFSFERKWSRYCLSAAFVGRSSITPRNLPSAQCLCTVT